MTRTKSDIVKEYALANNLEIIDLQLSGQPLKPPRLPEVLSRDNETDFTANTKPGDSFWIGIGKFSLWIQHLNEGVVIDAYPRSNEMLPEVGSLQLWNDDLKEEGEHNENSLYA